MKTILIVEDVALNRDLLMQLLEDDYALVMAVDGAAGVAMAASHTPDLILMDVVMPGQNGFQLTRAISRDPQYADVPIIMCTSKNQETDRVWGMRQGARGYITKPVDPAELQAKIDALISENPRLKEFKSQIRIDVTPDGLQIQIVDDQNRPMFDSGSALVKPYMRDILREIGAALGGVENRISLAGHTDAAPYGNGDRGYSNWELSADRANASRRELVAAGMPDAKLGRVV
ncbi:response regulator, partial [Rhizobium sp. 18055]|uniref:response regulator n=2 Tax=Pseudomonadota TaxID=1224 RepID=UPI00135A0354